MQQASHTTTSIKDVDAAAIKLDSAEAQSEEAKKKKKKNKNKKKGHKQAANATSEACGPRSDNLFDKTQSSLRGGAGDLTSNGTASALGEARLNGVAAVNPTDDADAADFTPLKDKIGQSFFDDQDSSEDEGMPDYKIGGYHPVHVGEILLDRYVII